MFCHREKSLGLISTQKNEKSTQQSPAITARMLQLLLTLSYQIQNQTKTQHKKTKTQNKMKSMQIKKTESQIKKKKQKMKAKRRMKR